MRGLGDYLDRRVEYANNIQLQNTNQKHGFGRKLLEKGIRKYVKLRISTTSRRRRTTRSRSPRRRSSPIFSNKPAAYRPSHFRHTIPRHPPVSLPPTAILPLEIPIPDFEPWILSLWHDFLIEPTPYLVLGCMIYLGGVLLVAQYYALIWKVVLFLLRFVPWDEEFGF